MREEVVNLPADRVGVLIGREGEVKTRIERATSTKLHVDSSTGDVRIVAEDDSNILGFMQAVNIVRAISYGFSPERAMRLLEEDTTLVVIDVSDYVGDSKDALRRVLGRVIGERGRARRVFEETTRTYISVYRKYVAIIGRFDEVETARRGVMMLIEGKPHKVVYNFLFDERRRRKRERLFIWEK